jgi:site-specific recombinase XerD
MRRSKLAEVRQLHRGHFAFLRAMLQGGDPINSWGAHMQLESSRATAGKIREESVRIRAECVAASRRYGQHRVTRLLLLELASGDGAKDAAGADHTARISTPEAPRMIPPVGPTTPAHKRARLIRRQLDALRGLEAQMLAHMSAGDPVSRWLPPNLAKSLEQARILTLSLLAARLNTNGVRWWRDVAAVSRVKAARIEDWARLHAQDMGMRFAPRAEGDDHASETERRGPSTLLAPLERFVVPRELDGHDGAFRMPRGECLLSADNDRQAIDAWLNDSRHASSSSSTFRSYRSEAERLLLWCVLIRRKAVSSLTHTDARAYRDFLEDPPESWCGPRWNRRDSQKWRPLEKGLSTTALGQALTKLGSLFNYLVTHRYVHNHPFLYPRSIDGGRPDARLQRTLTFAQWDRIEGELAAELALRATHEPSRRRARAIRWLYATGLSLSEMTSLRCGSLRAIRFRRVDGTSGNGWVALVLGRRGLTREVPVPPQLIAELGDELARAGRPRAPTDRTNVGVPVVGRFTAVDGDAPPTWTAGALYKAIKSFMEACAGRMEGEDAVQVRLVTSGWLRNTHGMHAVKGREGGTSKPVPPHHVAASMGCHAAWLISQHLLSTGAQRQEAMKDFWPSEDLP